MLQLYFLQLSNPLQALKSLKEASNIVNPTLSNGSMASVALMLNSHSLTLPVPSEPAFFMNNRTLSATKSLENNSEATQSSGSKTTSFQA